MGPSSLDQNYAELRVRMLKAVARICPPWLSAAKEDLVQNAILRLYELERRSEGDREFSASYLRKVAYSVLIDEIRRRRRRPEAPGDTAERTELHPDQRPGPVWRVFGSEVTRALRDCLSQLLADRRMAVTLHLYGHTVREAAGILDWAAKRTENLTYRGLKDLRSCLTEKGMTP